MQVTGLDHVNIRTADIPGLARFYSELLGLEPRDAPPPAVPGLGLWLHDASGRAIIHVGHHDDAGPGSTGPIHHVAFACSGKAEMIERLETRGVDYRVADNIVPGLTQIFTHDPQGILLELNFSGE